MNITARFIAVALFVGVISSAAPFAQAQTYVYPIGTGYNYGTTVYTQPTPISTPVLPTTGCIVITSYLTLGSTDAYTAGQVSALQQYLNRAGLLTGVSGVFDVNTYTAVIRFQVSHGISATGTVGPLTRAAMQQASCVSNIPPVVVPPTYPSNCYMQTNAYYTNSYVYNTCGVSITSANASYSYNTMTITLHGTGFSPNGNTVHFNGSTYNAYSTDGTSLTFTFSSSNYYSGNYSVYVVNANGATSNTITFPITSNSNGNNTVSISSINGPTSVQNGSSNTWNVSLSNNYYTNYNTQYYNNQSTNVNVSWGDNTSNSSQQVYLSGTQNVSFSHVYSYPGTYTMQVSTNVNGNQYVYKTLTVTVYGNGSNNYGSPYISYISPSSATVGSSVTIYGSGFSTYGNTIHFGNGGTMNVSSYNGTTIYYTIPSSVSGCDLNMQGGYCAQWISNITSGSYPVYVTNSSGQSSNTTYFTVR